MNTFSITFLLVAAFHVQSCNSQPGDSYFRGYQLDSPDEIYKLPDKLVEVSGLCLYQDGLLAMVQDEDDIVFIFDTEKGEVVDKVSFHKDGDHEGIAYNGSNLHVIRSDGDIFEIEDLKGKKTDSEHMRTPLKSKNDVEGFCYDSKEGEFLIACKGDPGMGLNKDRFRTVWGFNAAERKLDDEPKYVVDRRKINRILKKRYGKKMDRAFAPSAIEIHPNGEEIWMLAARGNVIVAMDRTGRLLDAAVLPSGIHAQPEGLTFGVNGELYVSNEGHKRKARILKFNRKKE